VGSRHHLHPDRSGLSVPGGGHGLGEPDGAELASVEHDGRLVLCRGPGGALARFGKPEIFNTDQGSQFTGGDFTGVLTRAGVRISMDGRGRWMDNVFIERLWRSLKYEDIYLKGYADGREAKAGIAQWVAFYNTRRPHMALDHRTPMAVWREGITGGLDGKAVDMTLRLDSAGALPTCPQPQQPQMMIA
jgi:putative transposase